MSPARAHRVDSACACTQSISSRTPIQASIWRMLMRAGCLLPGSVRRKRGVTRGTSGALRKRARRAGFMQTSPKAGRPCPNDRPCERICHAVCTTRVRLARPGLNVRGRDKKVCAPADIARTPRIDVRCSASREGAVVIDAATRSGLGCTPTFEVEVIDSREMPQGALAGEERSVQPVTLQTTVCGKIVLIRKCNTHSANWPRHASDTLFHRRPSSLANAPGCHFTDGTEREIRGVALGNHIRMPDLGARKANHP